MHVTISDSRRNGHAWVAEITGPDPQYGFARRFLKGRRLSSTITFDLERGLVYDTSCPDRQERRFVTVNYLGESLETLTYYEVCRIVESTDAARVRPLWMLPVVSPIVDDL
jgi:hypothetical protein